MKARGAVYGGSLQYGELFYVLSVLCSIAPVNFYNELLVSCPGCSAK